MTPWWQQAVIYQVYPQSFADSDGDGIGDLRGVVQRLDYLVDVLGVDAIWLNPFYRSPLVDGGYDVTDHCAVDPRFGTLADFDDLLAAAHRRGLRVMLDYLPSCTSDEHPWFAESSGDRGSAKRDWYVWRDPRPEGGPPNNWLAHWGGSAWTWHPPTSQYYLHTYLYRMPDLNWDNPDVRRAMFDVARFWLDRGVDGFRVDSAHIIGKDTELRDNPPNTEGILEFGRPHGEMDSQLHLYDRGTGDVHGIYREFRTILDQYDAVSVGEVAIADPQVWAGYYGTDLDELHMPFNFRLLGVEWNAKAVREVVEAVESALPEGAWPTWVLGNHDEPRIAGRIGAARARLAMVLLLTLRGTPTIYYGDELGMTDVVVPPDQVRDPWELRMPGLGLGRDPERSPMRWTTAANAGFCPPDAQPWLPMGDTPPVEVQLDDGESMLTLTRRLLRLRRERAELAGGRWRPVDGLPADCLGYLRELGTARSLVVLNFGPSAVTVDLAEFGDGEFLAGTHPRDTVDLSRLTVHSDEGLLVALT
jgi:alpha-glucosidase